VRLESNRTTGYQWRPAEPLDERIIRVSRSEYTPFDTSLTGAGGEESWTFYAVGKGDARGGDGVCEALGEGSAALEDGYDKGIGKTCQSEIVRGQW